jgi:hypothetical protein
MVMSRASCRRRSFEINLDEDGCLFLQHGRGPRRTPDHRFTGDGDLDEPQYHLVGSRGEVLLDWWPEYKDGGLH